MKKLILSISILFLSNHLISQIAPNGAGGLISLSQATNLTEINAIVNPRVGSIVYNLDDGEIYRYTGATNGWQKNTDDQIDSEVILSTPIDVNEGGSATPTNENTVAEVIEAIAPITSKAGRVFFPPSIEIDASQISTTDQTIDLYQQYANQYDLTSGSTTINGTIINYSTAKSPSAPNYIPIYEANDLYYYITFADTNIFDIINLSDTGVLTYRILNIPDSDNTLINVVFVVK